MIVSSIENTSRMLGPGEEIQWRCLARRGMLYSECEAFDFLRLSPSTEFALKGMNGTEGAWFIVRGGGILCESDSAHIDVVLEEHDLALLPDNESFLIHAGNEGMELLWLAVTSHVLTRFLPQRRPAI